MTTLPIPNVPLLRKAVEWAEVEAEKPIHDLTRQWDQGTFYMSPEDRWEIYLDDCLLDGRQANPSLQARCTSAYCIAGYAVDVEEGPLDDATGVEWRAQVLLGLTDSEAMHLFQGDNTIERIREVARNIALRAGEVL